ncbi:MAG: phosphomannomutase/phosphoglucomutase [Patescibacteria group bacterium]
MNQNIFKSYDIRGIYPGEINPEVAYKIARATVLYTGASSMVVGRDMRGSSPEISEAVIRGVNDQGADAIDIGLASTPLFYFAVADYELHDAGMMITASHNPKEYNGLKIVHGDGRGIGLESGLAEIRELALAGEFPDVPRGTIIETDARAAYIEKLFSFIPAASVAPLKVVVDAGNGMGGLLIADIFRSLPCEFIPMFIDLDGAFPNHEPNPVKEENLADLKKKVLAVGAHLGVAFDGDADRVGFVDERGAMVRGDIIAIILAKEIIKKTQGALVLGDPRMTNAFREEVKKAGGTFHFSKVGHANIKKQMKEGGAAFAGELSAHYYFNDFPGIESGDLAMLYVLRAMSSSGKSLSALAAEYGRYFHSGEINFTVEDKDKKIREAEERFSEGADGVLKMDGLRVDFPDWWFSLRASNTEPLLRLNLEATTKELMEEKKEELTALIKL